MRKNLLVFIKKETYFLLWFLTFGFTAHAQFPAPYCNVTFTSGVEPITLVNFAGINNPSPAAIGGAALEDFTAIIGTVAAGVSYPITLNGNTDGNYINYFRVYIDWNQNNDFLDPGESYDIGTITNNNGSGPVLVGDILVPVTALAGNTRMRVMKRFNTYPTGPCQTGTGYGQAEDYTLTVVAATPCSGTPVVGAATASVTTTCTAVAFNLNAPVDVAPGLTFQWESSTDGGTTWANLGTSQATVGYTVTSQSVATSYRVVVTCTASSLSATSASVVVAQSLVADCYCTNAINWNCTDGDLILNVTMGTINNSTGCGNTTTGYTNYIGTVAPAVFQAGTTHAVSVTVGPSGDGWLDESAGVWIDFNQNGVFEASEYTYVGTGLNEVLTTNILIPENAVLGTTRMRVVVAAALATAFNATYACGPLAANNNYGEMEDYAITIEPPLSVSDVSTSSISMYPNPTNGIVTLDFMNPVYVNNITVYSVSGQLVHATKVNTASETQTIDLQDIATGVYFVKIEMEQGTLVKRLVKN
ncbi:MAG: T9SS type A sorting domain-containing protein [Flavobacterium sp.]|nr:T9SS type A sorting domain-containing protein [Flavobacterium sp.]